MGLIFAALGATLWLLTRPLVFARWAWRAAIRPNLPDLLIVAGIAAIPAGVALLHVAAAIIIGGLELLVLGFVMARGSHGRTG